MTEIKYRQTFEDLLMFNEYVLLNLSSESKKCYVLSWTLVVLLIIVPAILLDLYFHTNGAVIAVAVIWSAISIYGYPERRRKRVRKNLRAYLTKYYKDDNSGMIGDHTVRLEDEFLVGTCATSESRYDLKIVEVKESPPYIYYFVGAGKAFVLSKENVISGDLAAFDSAVRAKIASLAAAKGN